MHVKLNILFAVFIVPLFLGNTSFSNPVHYAKGTAAYNEVGCSICKMHNNAGYLIAGYRESPTLIWVVKVDNNGVPIDSIPFPSNYPCKAKAIQPTNDGGYIMCGWQQRDIGVRMYLLKVDGALQNPQETYLASVPYHEAWDIKQTPDGGYIITGDDEYIDGIRSKGAVLVKTDSNGNIQWHRSYWDYLDISSGRSVIRTSAGRYVITGFTIDPVNNIGGMYPEPENVFVLQATEGGSLYWQGPLNFFGSPGAGYTLPDAGNCVRETVDGKFIIAGEYSYSGTDIDNWLIKVDNSLQLVWDKHWGGSLTEKLQAVEPLPGGTFAIAGNKQISSSNFDIYLGLRNSYGNFLSEKIAGGSNHEANT